MEDELETPWRRARKLRSQEQEERLGNLPYSRKQINSGRHWFSKRDAIVHEFLIEARTTDAGSYRIEKDEFLKIQREALQTPPGLLPGMQIDMGHLSLIAIRTQDFTDMFTRLVALEVRLANYE